MKNAESPLVAETGKRPAGGEDPASAFQVNGEAFFHGGDPAMPLLWYLRDVLRLTGTKYGCDTGNCGACTVLIDGKARRACQVPMVQLVLVTAGAHFWPAWVQQKFCSGVQPWASGNCLARIAPVGSARSAA